MGLPHTQFDDVLFSHCAFTAKAVRLSRMLQSTGRDVAVYWGDSLMGFDWQARHFGVYTADDLPPILWDANLPYWREFNQRCADAIEAVIKPGDIIAVVGGPISQVVVDKFAADYTCVEPGVGYAGLCPNTFACFESYAWMHNRYGEYNIVNGRPFDTVIPNAVDPNEWVLGESDGYALWVGRCIARKGPHVAAQIAEAAGLKLVMAGGGVSESEPGRVVATDGTIIEGDVEHIGSITGTKRRMIFAHAEVFLCPTLYIGPWEGVHAEAMMSGVGVAAPDYGVFTETLPTDSRYHTLKQATFAVEIARLTRGKIWRDRAEELCSTDVCTEKYDTWFDRLESLRDGRNGWYG